MRRILSLMIILMLVLSLVACGGDDIIGVWAAEDEGITITVEFTEDTMDLMGITMDYTLDGNEIVLSFMGQEQRMEYKVSGDTLTLIVDGGSQEFKRVED